MRKRTAVLLAALLALVIWTEAAAGGAVPRVQCEQPRRLQLERYEDGSARLLCAGRVLVRVGVPW